ncbi:hypothetical protein LTR09_010232 [Extremus antarcticus]|uniref:Uncharacterized protein n=1 Tax=Extremus antarcticus TaxID=702011 RepID=A0AAJ0D7N6_9PEZI|nr:hypothetical protein LTR09_010232 [Extremus antarcticus]
MDFSNLDYNDPESVMRAMGGGPGTNLPIPESVTPQKRSDQIFSDWNQLKSILDRHAGTIHKRWAKKTKTQRVEILLAAWPHMPATHRPDFAAFRKENVRQREAGTKFRGAYMWPYINLEGLSRPKTLPLLLDARSRNTPDVFAAADEDAAHLGYATQAIMPSFLNEYTMMFTGRKTPESYGELISWDDDDRAFEWLTSQRGMHPGQGLILLEMQQRILQFLVACCDRIMHDIALEHLGSEQYPVQPLSDLPRETVNGFESRAVMAAEAPYRAPASLDFGRLESLFAARVASAEDHVWALREDPSYFADAMYELKEHRQELIKDSNGAEHPLFKLHREEILWGRIIGNVVTSAYLNLELWNELHSQVQHLQSLKAKHEASISIDEDLQEEYLDALLKFQHYLDQASKGPLGQLKTCVPASPAFRSWFMRAPNGDPAYTKMQISSKPNMNLSQFEGELLWLLRVLWNDGHELFLAGLSNVVDELERLVQSEPKAKAMISSFIAEHIADLAIVTEAMRQLQIYQPWAAMFEEQMVDKKEGIMKEFAKTAEPWGCLLNATEGLYHSKIMRCGDPSDQKFYYPVAKRRTKENTEAMRSAEKQLDAFWFAIDQNLQTTAGSRIDGTTLRKLLAQPRTLQRTPEWAEPDRGKDKKDTDQAVESLRKPLSELYFDLERCTERTIHRAEGNKTEAKKKKTRGVPNPAANGDAAPLAQDITNDIQPNFKVDARALRVFRTLFYTPSANATPGEVPWTDFLHAMVATGFAPEKMYGSVWQFQPTKLDVERSIQFHEPHPAGKLPYRTARRFGRRLERAYGWFGGMFELASKAT